MNDTLQAVRAKIIEAVPEAGSKEIEVLTPDEKNFIQVADEHITLADVLRAIEEHVAVDMSGNFMSWGLDGKPAWIVHPPSTRWNLALPFDEQERDVIDFIGKVLGV